MKKLYFSSGLTLPRAGTSVRLAHAGAIVEGSLLYGEPGIWELL